MGALSSSNMTLVDWAKRLDPSGKIAKIVEMMSQTNEILQDAVFIQGNLPTGHRSSIRTGLPTVYWRLLNQGVLGSKSTTAQVDESCGMLESWSEIDVELANLGGNAAAVRLTEASAFLEAMGQELADTMLYGNSSVAPEEFNGLSIRYSSLSAANGQNIVAGGGAQTDNTSIWLICWGEQGVHGIFPQGSKAGIEHKNHGEVTVDNAGGVTGAKMRVYQDQFQAKAGIVVKDWRQACRIANIDISSDNADLIDLMIKALHRVYKLNGKAAFYMNRTMKQRLDLLRKADVSTGGQLGYEVVDGKVVERFRGIPVRICDVLRENESTVS